MRFPGGITYIGCQCWVGALWIGNTYRSVIVERAHEGASAPCIQTSSYVPAADMRAGPCIRFTFPVRVWITRTPGTQDSLPTGTP